MSDLISKKTLIIQALATSEGWDRTNSDIATQVGCEPSTVRKVRAELETDRLRQSVGILTAELAAFKAGCQCHDRAAKRPAKAARPRKVRNDDRPLFERETENGVEMICGIL